MRWTRWLPILAVVFSAGLLLAGCEGDAETSKSDSAETDDTSSNYPATGDFIAYTLDDGTEVIVEDEDDTTSPVGETPLLAASLDTESDYLEVILLDGFLLEGDDGEIAGGDLFIDLIFPNATGTHDDATDTIFEIVYGEGVSFQDFDASTLAYGSDGDGASSVTADVIGAVGEEVEGSFDGALRSFDGGTSHTMTGVFRVTRMADDEFGGGESYPSGVDDLTECVDSVRVEGSLSTDDGAVPSTADTGQCDFWYFETSTDASFTVTVVVNSGDASLYISTDADFAVLADSSDEPAQGTETVTVNLVAGDSAAVVVGANGATDYTIELSAM